MYVNGNSTVSSIFHLFLPNLLSFFPNSFTHTLFMHYLPFLDSLQGEVKSTSIDMYNIITEPLVSGIGIFH